MIRVCIMRCVSSNIYSPCPSIVEYKFSASCPTRTAEAWQSAGLVLADVELFFPSTDLRGIRVALFSFCFVPKTPRTIVTGGSKAHVDSVSHVARFLFAHLVYIILQSSYPAPPASDVLCNLSCNSIYLGQ